jgi:hypothetical protein
VLEHEALQLTTAQEESGRRDEENEQRHTRHEQPRVTPLSKPRGGSPDVKASVASQIPEDFTAHLEMHPLRHIHHLATSTILILHHLKELKLCQVPSKSIEMNLQDIPQNTEGY